MIYSQKNGARTNRYELHDSDKMDSSGAEEICANRNRFSVLKFTSRPLLIFTFLGLSLHILPFFTANIESIITNILPQANKRRHYCYVFLPGFYLIKFNKVSK